MTTMDDQSKNPAEISETKKIVVKRMAVVQHHSGPLPDPETLAGYENIVRGSAERILIMAEKEQDHRHITQINTLDMKNNDLIAERNEIKRSQFFAFITAMIIIICSALLIYTGSPVIGFILALGTLAAIISVFLEKKIKANGKNKKANEVEIPDDSAAD